MYELKNSSEKLKLPKVKSQNSQSENTRINSNVCEKLKLPKPES